MERRNRTDFRISNPTSLSLSVDWEREYHTLAQRRKKAERDFPAEGPGAAAACGDLADLLRQAGRTAEAETLYREALELWRRLSVDRPAMWLPLLAEACGDLADLLEDAGALDEAEELSREALGLWWELREADDTWKPDLAASCGALADLLGGRNLPNLADHTAGERNTPGEAEELSRESLRLWRELVQEDTAWEADLAEACRSRANLLALWEGGGKEAERLYCEALDLYRKLARDESRYAADAVLTCNNLGTFLSGQGRREAAEWFYRQALDLYQKYPRKGDGIPFAASACGNLAGLLEERRPGEAERLYRTALDAWRKLGDRCLSDTADACYRLASFLYAVRGDRAEAGQLLREAAALMDRDSRLSERAAFFLDVLEEWGLADSIRLPAGAPDLWETDSWETVPQKAEHIGKLEPAESEITETETTETENTETEITETETTEAETTETETTEAETTETDNKKAATPRDVPKPLPASRRRHLKQRKGHYGGTRKKGGWWAKKDAPRKWKRPKQPRRQGTGSYKNPMS